MFYTDLVKLQLEYTNRFHVYFILSQIKKTDLFLDVIEASTINYVAKKQT